MRFLIKDKLKLSATAPKNNSEPHEQVPLTDMKEQSSQEPPVKQVGRRRKAPKTDLQDLKRELEMDDHLIPIEELLTRLHTNLSTGLTSTAAKKRLQEDGPNALTPPPTTSEWVKFMKQLFGGFQILLWGGAILCFFAYSLQSTLYDVPPKDNVRIPIPEPTASRQYIF